MNHLAQLNPMPTEQFQKYRGKWIALDRSGGQVLGSADTLDSLEDQLAAAQLDPQRVVFDQIEDEDVIVGGAGLL